MKHDSLYIIMPAYNEEKNIYIDKYVIDVNKSLEKYKDTYGKYC